MVNRPSVKKTKQGLRGGFETQIAKLLSTQKKELKFDFLYESETFDINIKKKYTPDFVIELLDGRKKVVECKGYFPDEDRKKTLAFINDYPDIDFLIVFQKANRLYSGSNIRYSDWCIKNNIPYSIGSIPDDWLES